MSRYGKLVAGVALIAAGVLGFLHSARAAVASWDYYRARYAAGAARPDEVLRICERAYRRYPANHWLSQWAMDVAFADRNSGSREQWQACIEEAALWTGRGLRQNRYDGRLRQMSARLMSRRSPEAAVDYWREYLDWAFWSPEHHYVMIELCLAAGDYPGALESLRWIEGTPRAAEGRALVGAAWAREKEQSLKAAQKMRLESASASGRKRRTLN
jgi:hypothetical protein